MKNKILCVAGAAICFVVLLFVALDVLFPVKYYGIIKKYCKEYNVEPSVALAVIRTESKFRPEAVSSAGARGLMQLMPSTAKWVAYRLDCEYGNDKLFEPEYNIKIGIYYLGYLKTKFTGDYVLAAYNAGEGNINKWIASDGKIKFPETRNYIEKVNTAKRIYKFRVG